MIFAFGIVLTSSSISYSDYINNSVNSPVNDNQAKKVENDYIKSIKDITSENITPVTSHQFSTKNY